jgi:hypothetical protein
MRNLLKVLGLTTLGLLPFAATSEAATIQFIDTYTPTGSPVDFSNGISFDYTHDITPPASVNNSLQAFIDGTPTVGAGYDSSTDSLTSGSITFFFNVSGAGSSEKSFTLSLGGDSGLGGSVGNGTPSTFVVGPATFEASWVTNAGLLTVDLTRSNNNGTVTFVKSVLDVSGTRGDVEESQLPAPVPEPASLTLLGVGLAALAAKIRGKRKTASQHQI